jgi:kynureninase
MVFNNTADFAGMMDGQDELAGYKSRFCFPQHKGEGVIYFCGNSLGLQPKNVEAAMHTELESWRNLAIEGYFTGTNPWLYYHDYIAPGLAKLVGAKTNEVTVMNALTVNLHLLLFSFYRPAGKRYKILMEAGAFPSDQYAVETQVKHYGFNPDDAIIEVAPREGEKLIRHEDVLAAINANRESLALVLMGGINYYTGQLLNIAGITLAAHEAGAVAGWDLAHVTGNVPVTLHDADVDFAVWCSYKYLNAGPGAAGGVFVHEKHVANTSLPRLAGWWGNDEKTRFKMEKGFMAKPAASGWNVSTTQVFNMVALKASVELFEQAGMEKLRAKSLMLTSYLEFLLQQLTNLSFNIITPANPAERGAQLCLYFTERGREIHQQMLNNGIVVDYREPGVIRVAPAPLYCSFADVYRFYEILRDNF